MFCNPIEKQRVTQNCTIATPAASITHPPCKSLSSNQSQSIWVWCVRPLSTRSSCKLVLVPTKQQKEEVLAEKISLRFAALAFYCICLSRAVIAFALVRTFVCTHRESGKISKRERSQSDVHNLSSVQCGRAVDRPPPQPLITSPHLFLITRGWLHQSAMKVLLSAHTHAGEKSHKKYYGLLCHYTKGVCSAWLADNPLCGPHMHCSYEFCSIRCNQRWWKPLGLCILD